MCIWSWNYGYGQNFSMWKYVYSQVKDPISIFLTFAFALYQVSGKGDVDRKHGLLMRNNHKVAAKSKNLYLKASSSLQWFPNDKSFSLFQGLHTDEWALWEGETSILSPFQMGSYTLCISEMEIDVAFRRLFYETFLTNIFSSRWIWRSLPFPATSLVTRRTQPTRWHGIF